MGVIMIARAIKESHAKGYWTPLSLCVSLCVSFCLSLCLHFGWWRGNNDLVNAGQKEDIGQAKEKEHIVQWSLARWRDLLIENQFDWGSRSLSLPPSLPMNDSFLFMKLQN